MHGQLIGGGATTPPKHATLQLPEANEERGAHRGQVIIMFAGFLVAMMGMLGLATDVGYALAARRSVQAAADAGALAGARMIARYTPSRPTSAAAEVEAIVQKNTFGSVTPAVLSCEYIGTNWSVVGSCGQTVPSNAVGARVRTRATVPTFFIRVIPGAPKEVTVSGYAKARVEVAMNNPADGPFIVCGFSAWDVTSNPTGKGKDIGTNTDILLSASPFKINPNAIGKTFRIHDPQLESKGNADCKAKSGGRFKGLADQEANAGKTAPGWFTYDTGTKAGPTRTTVNGADGCKAGTGEPYNCVMILPIATNAPAESKNSKQVYVVGFAAFYVTTVDANSHNGQLLGAYIIDGPGSNTYTRDRYGTVVVRLVW